MATGQAMRMKSELAALIQRHQIAPAPFTAPALLLPTDGDVIVEGYDVTLT